LDVVLTRAKFESLCSDLFKKCEGPVSVAMKDSGLSTSDINEIILV
jgi:molecular chaperone DnaK